MKNKKVIKQKKVEELDFSHLGPRVTLKQI